MKSNSVVVGYNSFFTVVSGRLFLGHFSQDSDLQCHTIKEAMVVGVLSEVVQVAVQGIVGFAQGVPETDRYTGYKAPLSGQGNAFELAVFAGFPGFALIKRPEQARRKGSLNDAAAPPGMPPAQFRCKNQPDVVMRVPVSGQGDAKVKVVGGDASFGFVSFCMSQVILHAAAYPVVREGFAEVRHAEVLGADTITRA